MIAIKNMEEMPKGCWYSTNLKMSGVTTCPLKSYCSEKHIKEAPLDTRSNDCPLVEIITCKNCKKGHKYKNVEECYCDFLRDDVDVDFYCAEAERRE